MTLSPAQIRAARGLLDWTAKDLADRIGIKPSSMSAIENSQSKGSVQTLQAMEAAFFGAGVEFTSLGGVNPRQNRVITYSGKQGFADFRKDVLNDAQAGPIEISISNVDERIFDHWGKGEVNDEFRKEMAKLNSVSRRILIKEGDDFLTVPTVAEYRYVQESEFGDIPFYIYGKKTAIISFGENNFQTFIIDHPSITAFFQQQFDRLWARAKPVR